MHAAVTLRRLPDVSSVPAKDPVRVGRLLHRPEAVSVLIPPVVTATDDHAPLVRLVIVRQRYDMFCWLESPRLLAGADLSPASKKA